jgi:putative hydrolase of the HAD superfamily
VSDSHRAFCRAEGLDPDAFGALLHGDKAVSCLSRRFEAGEIAEGELETEVARALGGADAAEGLIGRLFADLELDAEMVGAVGALRAGGVRTVLITNSYAPRPTSAGSSIASPTRA